MLHARKENAILVSDLRGYRFYNRNNFSIQISVLEKVLIWEN